LGVSGRADVETIDSISGVSVVTTKVFEAGGGGDVYATGVIGEVAVASVVVAGTDLPSSGRMTCFGTSVSTCATGTLVPSIGKGGCNGVHSNDAWSVMAEITEAS
jgi:hypothetical protein